MSNLFTLNTKNKLQNILDFFLKQRWIILKILNVDPIGLLMWNET
jgi:hypothetical protein